MLIVVCDFLPIMADHGRRSRIAEMREELQNEWINLDSEIWVRNMTFVCTKTTWHLLFFLNMCIDLLFV